MPRKTLENLTFALLKATTDVEDAEDLASSMPILQNKMALCVAEENFEAARVELSAELGHTSIYHYIQGIQKAAGRAAERASESIGARKAHRLFIDIRE